MPAFSLTSYIRAQARRVVHRRLRCAPREHAVHPEQLADLRELSCICKGLARRRSTASAVRSLQGSPLRTPSLSLWHVRPWGGRLRRRK